MAASAVWTLLQDSVILKKNTIIYFVTKQARRICEYAAAKKPDSINRGQDEGTEDDQL